MSETHVPPGIDANGTFDIDEDCPFEGYLLYRFRMDEMIHLQAILTHIDGECTVIGERPLALIRTLHLIIATHLAGFFDSRDDSLNVFKVWPKTFPQHAAQIEEWRKELEPVLKTLVKVRHKAGAHADLKLRVQNQARLDLADLKVLNLFQRFCGMADVLTKSEASVPGLPDHIAACGLDPGESYRWNTPDGELPENGAD